jgi:hypothetical protein
MPNTSNPLPAINITLRVPKRDEPGGMYFYMHAGDAHRFLTSFAKTVREGKMPSVDQFERLIECILLFVPRDQKQDARTIILDWSITQLTVAIQTLTAEYVRSLQEDVDDGRLQETPQLRAAAQLVTDMGNAVVAEGAEL